MSDEETTAMPRMTDEEKVAMMQAHADRVMAEPRREDRAYITYWLPRLEASGVRVPETYVVTTDVHLFNLLDDESETPDGWDDFIAALRDAASKVGYPCFLRTGYGSGKHQWRETCFVPSAEDVPQHVFNLVEWSACVDVIGRPTRAWAIRRLLDLDSTFMAFDGLPVNRERRYFVDRGRVLCRHPYWPAHAVADGAPEVEDWRARLEATNDEPPAEVTHLTELAERVSVNFDGAWSLDFAADKAGVWWAIDMAPAERSYHWPGCTAARTAP